MLKVHIYEDDKDGTAASKFEHLLNQAIVDKIEIRDLHYSVTTKDKKIVHSMMVVCFYMDEKDKVNPITQQPVKPAVEGEVVNESNKKR
jgi:hypothetical protein